jgi:hypothetical protein
MLSARSVSTQPAERVDCNRSVMAEFNEAAISSLSKFPDGCNRSHEQNK